MTAAGASTPLPRYARQQRLPGVGTEGQARLTRSSVLIVGVGGLGVPAAQYLAAAGVGRIGLVDADVVDVTNLHRQPLYGTPDVGQTKVAVAARRLRELNPDVVVETFHERLTSANAQRIMAPFDVILDCSDNFPTRYLVNDACVLAKKPDVFGAAHRFEGQVSVFWAGHGPCYRCLQAKPPAPDAVPSCEEAGVLGPVPAAIGVAQATEALKILLGVGQVLTGRVLLYDALDAAWVPITLRRNPECAACGDQPTITHLIDYEAFCRPPVKPMNDERNITPTQLKQMMDANETFVLLDVRQPEEVELVALPGSLHIPAWDVPGRVAEIDGEKTVVVYCHHGTRSGLVANWLRSKGFERVKNLRGGIDAWAQEIDSSMPTY